MNLKPIIALLFLMIGEFPASGATRDVRLMNELSSLEKSHGGRLGVVALDLGSHRRLSHRSDERFAMCSTFKLLLAAAIAARVDAGELTWEKQIPYSSVDLLSYAPITGKPENVKAGSLSASELCTAAVQLSDNTAANLLLKSIGGPDSFTRYLRSLGDSITRLDRNEPDLNTNLENDIRDTTTPAAMVVTMEKLLLGDALTAASREKLTNWLIGNKTGDKRIRAGFGKGWKIGDKTGTGENGAANDVAIVWPADQASEPAILIAVFYTGSSATPEQRDEVIAKAATIVRDSLNPPSLRSRDTLVPSF